MRSLELKILPVFYVLTLGGLMAGTAWFTPGFKLALHAGRVIAAGLVSTGIIVVILGGISFRRAGTTINPRQPSSTSRLVMTGIYRVTRNPMYLGMLLLLLGWGLILSHALAFLLATAFVPIMNRMQIGPEERILTDRFGSEFVDYQTAVRRWL